jgi:hypothetical protein
MGVGAYRVSRGSVDHYEDWLRMQFDDELFAFACFPNSARWWMISRREQE